MAHHQQKIKIFFVIFPQKAQYTAVSYTHLDVYKRQHYSIKLNGTKISTAVEFGTEYLGKIVETLENGATKANPIIYGLTVKSVEVTVDKDNEIEDITAADTDDLDAIIKGLQKTPVANVLKDGTVKTGQDEKNITAGTYYAFETAEGVYKLITKIDDVKAYTIENIVIADPADKDDVVKIDGTGYTAKELEEWYKTNKGLDVEAMEAGTYAVAKVNSGTVVNYTVLKTVAPVKVASKTTSGKTLTFVADGKTYEVLNASYDAYTTALGTNLDAIDVTFASLEVGEEYALVEFDGKVIAVDSDAVSYTHLDVYKRQ